MHYNENYTSTIREPPSKSGVKDDKGYVYKKSSYQYSSSGNNNASSYTSNPTIDKNIDQLDALLEDLKTERQFTRDRDLLSTGVAYRTLERERADPPGAITKTTSVLRTTKQSGANQGLNDERLENFSTSDYSTLKSNGYSTLHSNAYDDYQTTERSFGARNMYESKSKIYESNRALENIELVPQSVTTTTATSNLAKDLPNFSTLSDDILPLPGTKVTTTVRTYTYEVPAGIAGPVVGNRLQQHNTLNYSTKQQNTITNGIVPLQQSHPAINTPQTVVYNTESYSSSNKHDERPIVSNQTYEIREQRETNTLRNHMTPQQPRTPVVGPTGGTTRITYNTTENIHSVPVSIVPELSQYTLSPVHSPSIPTGSPHSPLNGHLPPGSTTNRYYYKESTNSVNTIHGPGGTDVSNEPQYPTQNAPPTAAPRYPPNGDDYPPGHPNTSTVTYKYSSSTMNSRRGPDYGTPSPSTQLSPFPVDGVDYPVGNGNPPQRVDDLMQSFSNADATDRPDLETPHRKREIETAVASPNQQQIPSINKAGKEVYYPPGHEMMLTKREEMSSGSASGGRWAKGSGMYEYESGSKSKTTSKSGGAMVPVCLPLCCAMPCSIM